MAARHSLQRQVSLHPLSLGMHSSMLRPMPLAEHPAFQVCQARSAATCAESTSDEVLVLLLFQVLNRSFMTVVVLLDGFWRAGPSRSAEHSAVALGALAWLQFCRLRTSLYSALLKDGLSYVVNSTEVGLPGFIWGR